MVNLLIGLTGNWASFYANHAAVRTSVTFMHIAGLVGGGGCAIAADRATLIASGKSRADRRLHLDSLHAMHRIVVSGLTAVIISGVLLFAADVDSFVYSRLFWLKMGFIALLAMNGIVLIRAERRARRDPQDDAGWSVLRAAAVCSLTLWFATTLIGAALPNIG